MQSGQASVQSSANEVLTTHINFPEKFSKAPSVSVNIKTSDPTNKFINAGNINTDGFDVFTKGVSSSSNQMTICWLAIEND